MQNHLSSTLTNLAFLIIGFTTATAVIAQFPGGQPQPKQHPWSDASLSPDTRADLVIKEMTLDEKILMLHGGGRGGGASGMEGGPSTSSGMTVSNGGAGFSNGVPRLDIPAIQMADSAYGVTRGAAMGRYSTALPNNLAAASAWDLKGPLGMAH